MNDFYQIIICRNIPYVPFASHLWFILPYMIISCFFVVHQYLLSKQSIYKYRLYYVLLNFLGFIAVRLLTDYDLICYVFCYNIFMLLGYCYYKKLSIKSISVVGIVLLVGVILLCVWGDESLIPMQSNKFPPNAMFVLYSLFALCLLSIVFSKVKLRYGWVLSLWNKRGYTIYLYQSLAYTIVDRLLSVLQNGISSRILLFGVVAVLLFICSMMISYVAYPIEQFVVKKIRS